MIDVQAARERITGAIKPICEIERLALTKAAGRVLAEPVRADCDVPPADNSAMDGYALRTADLHDSGGLLPVVGRVAAGCEPAPLKSGTAVRIFTGAWIPKGADAVVMQERCAIENGLLRIEGEVKPGANIRRAGEDIARGHTALPAGRRLRPQDLGMAASLGCSKLVVRRAPRVAVLCTGDELVAPGERLAPGQIYESNGTMLEALLHALGCEPTPVQYVPDTLAETEAALVDAAKGAADLIICSGGVSVGEEDHVKAAVQASGRLDLWKIAVKPGKPLAFGTFGTVPFLGLPGNPVSLFVTFLLFGAPLIRKLQGREHLFPEAILVPAGFARKGDVKREEYLRVRIENGQLAAHPRQGSSVLSSAVWADGLARVPAEATVSRGDVLDYYSFAQLLA